MPIDSSLCPLPLIPPFIAMLEKEMEKFSVPAGSGAILSFRDPSYSPTTGGFHPVEISIDPAGRLLYITDFSFAGRPPFAELVKEIDFDFSLGLFQHFGHDFPIPACREFFVFWQRNFVSYYRMGIYAVSVEQH